MESEYEKYQEDPRIPCQYGNRCYQKNPVHLGKYKHPPKKHLARGEQPRKKFKAERMTSEDESDSHSDSVGNSNEIIHEKVANNDVSDSEEEEFVSDSKLSRIKVEQSIKETDEKAEIGTSDYNSESDIDINPNDNESSLEKEINNDVSDSEEETLVTTKKISVSHSRTEESNDTNTFKDSKELTIKSGFDESKSLGYENSYTHEFTFIKEHFLVEMPQDFFQFWDFCKKIKPANPLEAFKPIGLTLVGPFDVLAGEFSNVDPNKDLLIHWRYFRDPPELQTVLKGDDITGYHIGYFRDSPEEKPIFLVKNQSNKDGFLHQMGSNIFAALNIFLEDHRKSGDPFKKLYIDKIQSALKNEVAILKIDMSQRTPSMVQREKKIVTRTFNKIGLVVPYDKKTELGYRALALNNRDLKILFDKLQDCQTEEEKAKLLSELQPVLTYATIATDECDFGTGIELGWNIISHGVNCLNFTASRFLETNYKLLKREAFGKIAVAHMKNRRTGSDLSIL